MYYTFQVDNTTFRTHKYKLDKFSVLKDLMQRVDRLDRPRPMPTISVQRGTDSIEDFKNMFKVLYASVVKGPFIFETPVLISTLRVSTVYDYPALRAFSITFLEGASLSAIQRIQLAREFRLTTWEGPAYNELYTREEAITREEARALGCDAFSVVARMREENLKKGKAAVREAAAQARRNADEQASRVTREREREKRAMREAFRKALSEAEKANREAINRVMQEADERANRVSLERDRREAEAMKETQKTQAAARADAEKAKKEAINQVKREVEEQTNKLADWMASRKGRQMFEQTKTPEAWKQTVRKRWVEIVKESEKAQEWAYSDVMANVFGWLIILVLGKFWLW
ncbi:hypothetical protein BDV93DRAFT_76835 [Ceratobasidium sp. AG-I]|nr:hypothetical protein BDV93DRAFT_76835 [Ceratobasidium sp. AG-I]